MDTIKTSYQGPAVTTLNGASNGINLSLACPAFNAPEGEKLAWLEASANRGRAFLSAQPSFQYIELAAQILQGMLPESVKKDTSDPIFINTLKRQMREIIAIMHNLNPEWKYHTPAGDDQYYERLTSELNLRLGTWWKGNTFPAKSIQRALQFAATCCGYISPVWTSEIFGSDASDIDLKVYGPEDVLVDQITDDWNLNKAYAVTLYERVPTIRLKQLWPEQEAFITSSALNLTDMSSRGVGTQPQGIIGSIKGSAIFSLLSGGGGITDAKQAGGAGGGKQLRTKVSGAQNLSTDVYMTYVADAALNTTGDWLDASRYTVTDKMHSLNSVTDFKVPPIGVPVSFGTNLPDDPAKIYAPERCLLYPTRRLIIWTPSHILYDGPSTYAHGQVPLVKIQLDPQVWNYLGGCLVEENRPAASGYNDVLKQWYRSFKLRIDPPVEFDTAEISPTQMQQYKLYSPGTKIPRKGLSNQPAIRPIHDYHFFDLGNEAMPLLRYLTERMDHNVGTNDFSSLMKMNAIPDGDGIEKLMSALGPLVSDYAANLEAALTQLGYMCQWLWLQFDTTSLRISRGDSPLDVEFDSFAGNLIPAELPNVDKLTNSSFFHRLRAVGKKIRFNVVPQSVFNVTDWKRKMLALQLYREPAFPMDSKTIADILGLEGFGEIEGDTVFERWVNERKMMLPFESMLQTQNMQRQMVGQAVGQVQAQTAAQLTAQQMQSETGINILAQLLQQQQLATQPGGLDNDDSVATTLESLLGAWGLGPREGNEGGMQISPSPPAPFASSGPGRPPTGGAPPEIETKTNPDGSERLTVTES